MYGGPQWSIVPLWTLTPYPLIWPQRRVSLILPAWFFVLSFTNPFSCTCLLCWIPAHWPPYTAFLFWFFLQQMVETVHWSLSVLQAVSPSLKAAVHSKVGGMWCDDKQLENEDSVNQIRFVSWGQADQNLKTTYSVTTAAKRWLWCELPL